MGIDITVGTSLRTNADSYSIVEDSTPLSPHDSTGSVGSITVSLPQSADAKHLRGKTVLLSDGTQGTTVGVANALSGDGQTLNITADGRLNVFASTHTAAPYSGTLGGAFAYYCNLVGITTGVSVDPSIASRPVNYAGFIGVVWTFIKQMCAAQQVEVALVSNTVLLRAPRQRIAQNYRDSVEKWTLDASLLAQSVQVYHYDTVAKTNSLVYPIGGWDKSVKILQVDAGQTLTFDISLAPSTSSTGLGASLSSIVQPTCVATVSQTDASASQYSVIGSDGGAISPTDWLNGGGSVTAVINPDSTSIKVTVVGSQTPMLATPFRIASPLGPSGAYSSLRLLGSGVFFDKQLLTFSTGVDPTLVGTVIGATVDNPAIQNMADAYTAALHLLAAFGSPRQTLTVTTRGINRIGDTGAFVYPMFSDFDAAHAGETFSTWDATWAGKTFAQFDSAQFALVASTFDNQAFGNVGGARVLNDNQWYRIRNVSAMGPHSISYAAESDTILSDFGAGFAGMTFAQFDAIHSGQSFNDFDVQPLRMS